jgi:hypothetical protein
MTVEEVLDQLLGTLDRCGVPYMVAGSFASNIHGIPRATYDADIVVELDRPQLPVLLKALENDFYCSEEAAREALARRSIFNLIHFETGFKIDLILKKARAFSQQEFARRLTARLAGKPRWFASPEDVILTKLEWSRQGESERQFQDALSVARIQGDALDHAYLERWAAQLGLSDLLARLFASLV